jgi:hypothetical protein
VSLQVALKDERPTSNAQRRTSNNDAREVARNFSSNSAYVILTLALENGALINDSIQRTGKNSVNLSTIILIVRLLGFFLWSR